MQRKWVKHNKETIRKDIYRERQRKRERKIKIFVLTLLNSIRVWKTGTFYSFLPSCLHLRLFVHRMKMHCTTNMIMAYPDLSHWNWDARALSLSRLLFFLHLLLLPNSICITMNTYAANRGSAIIMLHLLHMYANSHTNKMHRGNAIECKCELQMHRSGIYSYGYTV